MRTDAKQISASAEVLFAAAAFTLGGVAYMAIEGWMGTTMFILGAAAAVGALWVARWETTPEAHKRAGWEDIPDEARDHEAEITTELVIGASAFLLGSVAFMSIEGTLGLAMFLLGAATSLGALWVAHHEARFEVD